jgi:hypothetical protein
VPPYEVRTLFHRPPRFRRSHLDRDDHHRRDRHVRAADRAVSGDRAADGRRHARYPGANAQVVSDSIATPIEQQINGVENMLYMSSQCNNDGSLQLTVTFALGTNLDIAQVQVQNRVALAEPQLPEEVRRQGVTVRKSSPDITLVIQLSRPATSLTGCTSAISRASTCATRLRASRAWATSACSARATTRCACGSTRRS